MAGASLCRPFTPQMCNSAEPNDPYVLVLQGEPGANGVPGLDGRGGHPVSDPVVLHPSCLTLFSECMLWSMLRPPHGSEVDKAPWWNVWWPASQFYNWLRRAFCQTWNPNTCFYVFWIYPHGEQFSQICLSLPWKKSYVCNTNLVELATWLSSWKPYPKKPMW